MPYKKQIRALMLRPSLYSRTAEQARWRQDTFEQANKSRETVEAVFPRRTTPGRWYPGKNSLRSVRGEADFATPKLTSKGPPPELGKAIRDAIRGGKTLVVKELLTLRGKGSLAGQSPSLMRDFHLAVKLGHEPIVLLLLSHGADPDAPDAHGRTPLHLACIHGHLPVTTTLLEHGADIHTVFTDESRYQHFPLTFAARMGHVDVMRALIQHGANVNTTSSRGLTALHYAAVRDQAQAINVLIETGVVVEARVAEDDGGGTALHASAVMRCLDATRCLLRHGADVHARNAFGYTPLHGVARQAGKAGAVEVADLLLRYGADETAVDEGGSTPADLCESIRARTVLDDERHDDDIERMRILLERAPADRTWRRRGYLVFCRTWQEKVGVMQASSVSPAATGACTSAQVITPEWIGPKTSLQTDQPARVGKRNLLHMQERETKLQLDLGCIVTSVCAFAEEGLFRKVVSYL